jgi:hypothetical protein
MRTFLAAFLGFATAFLLWNPLAGAPGLRKSKATSCLRLFTLRPVRSLRSVPDLRFSIARLTLRAEPFAYFRPFFAVGRIR